ncbi:hypothetical protein AVEN_157597-1 [Araneus ventricosus]|uniref:DUF4817 domain-containing protein n=1 Tax=Araneus ventricosus TaxID=182803 RepID=A0A4Y2EB06_ARAVE|nr:hypothetical protein AVEN_157597-1 [Araneus ventricosus]
MFYLCDQRPAETLKKGSSAFKNRPNPSSSMLTALIAKFERTGSVADDKVAMKTKQKTARTSEKNHRCQNNNGKRIITINPALDSTAWRQSSHSMENT